MTDQLIGRALQHYVVVRKIGEGGMGAVYLARDPRLQRAVAIKVLPAGASDARRERFVREARAASALNHPHIVTIHDIGRDGDVHFIVMEYVEGQPLDVLIPLGGLPIRDAVEYAMQIADAVWAPLHLVNITLNQVTDNQLAWQERRALPPRTGPVMIDNFFEAVTGRASAGERAVSV